MKLSLTTVARAIVELAEELPAAEAEKLAESVAAFLIERGDLRLLRLLPRALEQAYYEHCNLLPTRVVTPSGKDLSSHKELLAVFEKIFAQKLDVSEEADPSIIGGARIAVGDERFNFSLSHLLAEVRTHLMTPVS